MGMLRDFTWEEIRMFQEDLLTPLGIGKVKKAAAGSLLQIWA